MELAAAKRKGRHLNAIAINLLGQFIKRTGPFRGKNRRLIPLWMDWRDRKEQRIRNLPGNGKVQCDFSIPYECMVWLEEEEESDLRVLAQILKPGDSFIDCGANVGLWSLVASATVGPQGRVLAIEPNPLTANKLLNNIALSMFDNMTVKTCAVGDATGELLLQAETEHNISRVVPICSGKTIQVAAQRLDDLIGAGKFAGCKIDVEGFELQVLKGAQKFLTEQKPWLCVEFNSILSGVKTLREWDVHNFLTQRGYTAFRFYDAKNCSPKNILSDDFECQGYCNLFYSAKS